MKTEVINIGVPIEVYVKHSSSEIKEMVIKAITERRIVEVDEQPIKHFFDRKHVTMSIRLPMTTAKAVRRLANEHALPIVIYTCKLLDGGE